MMTKNRTVIIISHIEDLDGLVSAALVKKYLLLQNYSPSCINIRLTTYPNLPNEIRALSNRSDTFILYILDLGLNYEILSEIEKNFPKKTDPMIQTHVYFDHHEFPNYPRSIEQILNNYFNIIVNPSRYKAIEKEASNSLSDITRKCTADLIYETYPLLKSSFWDQLVYYAHLMDFKSDNITINCDIAQNLNQYISFYQNDEKKIYDLLDCMNDPISWKIFLQQLPKAMISIKKWYSDQISLISKSKIQSKFLGYSVIAAWADLRSGEITSNLRLLYPEVDLILGLSVREKYLNIRTSKDFAHRLAEIFGGGGHKDRAGFSLPSKWENVVQKYSSDLLFPSIILEDFLQQCTSILRTDG
ncbi:hypothetical protein NEF87_003884 [Candidatus Lokiarchaeum ossiferum]|uniref:DHHA1 domain-containing protein n=1 Tax=Candidatus Lokiarchaeum ossiferum TaxID=2951803 RepID=A0ABY6HYG9_9ARCH|nr:hypothetical protein NEF87_003884 [Candidatus Lokiarchaeum sp. B-35]